MARLKLDNNVFAVFPDQVDSGPGQVIFISGRGIGWFNKVQAGTRQKESNGTCQNNRFMGGT